MKGIEEVAGIALQEIVMKQGEPGGIDIDRFFLGEACFADAEIEIVGRLEAGDGFDLGEAGAGGGYEGKGGCFPGPFGFADVRRDAMDAVGARMVGVIGKLVGDPEEDQQTGGHADGQAEDVDEGEDLTFHQVAPGDLKEVEDHNRFEIC